MLQDLKFDENGNFSLAYYPITNMNPSYSEIELDFDPSPTWVLTVKNISHYYNFLKPENDPQSYVGYYGTWSFDFKKIANDKPDLKFSLKL